MSRRTRKLDAVELRVLGALLEKEQTTPDQYPLTVNALIAACNQKTGRNPVTQLTETQVVEALDRMREDVLVWRSDGARVERWKQSVDRRWGLDKRSKAVMTLLLLRGPQTVGELRTRSERMHRFDSVGDVEAVLQDMSEGFDALVRELPRQPGKRETRWTHLEGDEEAEKAMLGDAENQEPPTPRAAPRPATPAAPSAAATAANERVGVLEEKVNGLSQTVDELQQMVATLNEQMAALRSDLGVDE